jgi:hypothetical protein
MFRIFRQPSSSRATPLKPIAGIATTALLVGWAAGAGAQTASERMQLPPLPPAKQDNASNNTQPTPQQVDTQQQPQQAAPDGSTNTLPPLPLGRDGIREVQNQLIALGFDPGAADGQAGPVTVAAAQQYDQSRGGSGRVSIDSALLARLKADTAPRLTYDQVAARSSQSHSAAQAPASGANQIGSVVQQLAPLVGAVVNNSNSGNYGGGYDYGRYPGPGYYGPGPVYGYPYRGY